MDKSVLYYAQGPDGVVYCTEKGISLEFREGSINLRLLSGNKVRPEARIKLPGVVNLIKGRNPELWRTDISTFGEIVYTSVYPGIDLVYNGDQRRLKYTFYVNPGADPDQIKMMYEGVENIYVDQANRELVIQTKWGEFRDLAPLAYQDINGVRHSVDMEFCVREDGLVDFIIGKYNPGYTLVLDPTYSTYLGGGSEDYCYAIDIDNSGNAYVTGMTESKTGFPLKNPYDGTLDGGTFTDPDAFVTKISSSGRLIYSTYFGGSERDIGYGIAADNSGNAYITGWTNSDVDFPIKNAYQGTCKSRPDAFMAKLSSTGGLEYSTYLGGGATDWGAAIASDSEGNVVITGWTYSKTDFPLKDAFQNTFGGGSVDAFVAKLSKTGGLVYSTFLGGNSSDLGHGVAIDGSGNAYIVGETFSSTGFPIKNAYQGTLGGHYDAFVTKLSSTGGLEYSTYFGGDKWDYATSIAVSSLGVVCITGRTESAPSKFPIKNAFQGNIGGGKDAFVAKFSSGLELEYCTYLGGGGYDDGRGVAMDSAGKAYVTGTTGSYSDFPLKDAFQNAFGGSTSDAFVTKLSSTGELEYSTYLGGKHDDRAYGIAADDSETFYVTGDTASNNFYTKNAFQNTNKFNIDGFVTKLNTLPPANVEVKLPLQSDGNFISIPVIASNNTLSEILKSIEGNYSAVYAYNREKGEWTYYFANAPSFLNNLNTIEAGKGYLIKMNVFKTLDLKGEDAS
ncbi:hypothetical protein FJZ33_07985, partial [Candidatus Poribacteria bacterium]|nr:hypothetical protein [Candidatus Poribacteria bacterium]